MNLKSEIQSFDDNFVDGVFTIPREKNSKRIKVRALFEYCREKGLDPKDLSEKELERFVE